MLKCIIRDLRVRKLLYIDLYYVGMRCINFQFSFLMRCNIRILLQSQMSYLHVNKYKNIYLQVKYEVK